MKHSFPIVHPQGTHVNITEVGCEKLDLYSSGTHVKFLTQGVTLGIQFCLVLAFKSASSDRSLHIICPRYEKEVTTFNIFPPIVILCALITSFSGVNVHDTRF